MTTSLGRIFDAFVANTGRWQRIRSTRLEPIAKTFICLLTLMLASTGPAQTFRVAAYNVETYLDQPTATRHEIKSPEAKAKVRESILAINPDVLALQ